MLIDYTGVDGIRRTESFTVKSRYAMKSYDAVTLSWDDCPPKVFNNWRLLTHRDTGESFLQAQMGMAVNRRSGIIHSTTH
jgi:hypothetical protein